MAKISRHGGASVEPGTPVRIARAEIGFSDQPSAKDETEADNAEKDIIAKEAVQTEATLAKQPAKKATTKK